MSVIVKSGGGVSSGNATLVPVSTWSTSNTTTQVSAHIPIIDNASLIIATFTIGYYDQSGNKLSRTLYVSCDVESATSYTYDITGDSIYYVSVSYDGNQLKVTYNYGYRLSNPYIPWGYAYEF